MAPPRYLPSESILAHWVTPVEEGGLGLTHQQVADRVFAETGVRVSRSSVSASLTKAGLTKRVRYKNVIPWRVRTEHNWHHFLNMLRLEGRRQSGLPLTDRETKNLDSFKKRLKDAGAVVTYLEDTDEGWFLVKARPGVDKGLIREP